MTQEPGATKTLSTILMNSATISMQQVQALQNELRALRTRVEQQEIELLRLKKMNNLALLEHKLCDRMDDVVKAMTRTMADRFETAKKFRIMENQLKNVFELTLIALRDTDENFEIKQTLNNITKSSKKL